jgi:hypothetical protein
VHSGLFESSIWGSNAHGQRQEISTKSLSSISCMAIDQHVNGPILTGFSDGSVKLFDRRLAANERYCSRFEVKLEQYSYRIQYCSDFQRGQFQDMRCTLARTKHARVCEWQHWWGCAVVGCQTTEPYDACRYRDSSITSREWHDSHDWL